MGCVSYLEGLYNKITVWNTRKGLGLYLVGTSSGNQRSYIMEIKMAAKKRITRGVLILTLFVIGIVACSNLASKTPTPITPTKLPETTSYQFVLEKSLG